nr:MAG TPA: HCMV UL42 [Caudoviricetes sp.]
MAMTVAVAIFLAVIATVVASMIFGKEDKEEGK